MRKSDIEKEYLSNIQTITLYNQILKTLLSDLPNYVSISRLSTTTGHNWRTIKRPLGSISESYVHISAFSDAVHEAQEKELKGGGNS